MQTGSGNELSYCLRLALAPEGLGAWGSDVWESGVYGMNLSEPTLPGPRLMLSSMYILSRDAILAWIMGGKLQFII